MKHVRRDLRRNVGQDFAKLVDVKRVVIFAQVRLRIVTSKSGPKYMHAIARWCDVALVAQNALNCGPIAKV